MLANTQGLFGADKDIGPAIVPTKKRPIAFKLLPSLGLLGEEVFDLVSTDQTILASAQSDDQRKEQKKAEQKAAEVGPREKEERRSVREPPQQQTLAEQKVHKTAHAPAAAPRTRTEQADATGARAGAACPAPGCAACASCESRRARLSWAAPARH